MFSYLSPQQRLAQMEAMYPQFTPAQFVRASIVMNKEEANAQQVAMDGSISLFLNKATNEIYAKKLGSNGLPEFYTYTLANTEAQKDNYTELKDEIAALKARLEDLTNAKLHTDISASKPIKKQPKPDECD